MRFIFILLFLLPVLSFAQTKVEDIQSKIPAQRLSRLYFDVSDADIRAVLQKEVKNTLKLGQVLDHKVFVDECKRIEQIVNRYAYPPFSTTKVTYTVDTISESSYNLKILVKNGIN